MMSPDGLPYRPCVGVILVNREGLVFAGKRIVENNSELSETQQLWQMPQGGIDAGESAEAAARRELFEETGVKNAKLMCRLSSEQNDWFYYDLPNELIGKAFKGKYRGQAQKWFVFEFTGDDSEINLQSTEAKAEFDAWAWKNIDDLPELVVPFKRELYLQVVDAFHKLNYRRRVVLVGCGNMGYAMLQRWLGHMHPQSFFVIEPDCYLRTRAAELGVYTFETIADLKQDVHIDLIILAVKPQIMADVLPDYRSLVEKGATVLTVAAGLKVEFYEKILGTNAPIIRCMPNTSATIGEGVTAYFKNAHVTELCLKQAQKMLLNLGLCYALDNEDLIDAVTAVSGSGPAYVFHFIECLISAAQEVGLSPMAATQLAIQTLKGAVLMAEQNPDVATLRENVTSPNGTTAAGLSVLMREDGLQKLINETVHAAYNRSIEMSAK